MKIAQIASKAGALSSIHFYTLSCLFSCLFCLNLSCYKSTLPFYKNSRKKLWRPLDMASHNEVVRLTMMHFEGAVFCYSFCSLWSTYNIYIYFCYRHFALCLFLYVSAMRQSHHKDKHNVSCRKQSICTWRLCSPFHN